MHLKINSHGVRTPDSLIFRHLRITAGLTVQQLARLIGCDRSYITHYEAGRNGVSAKARQNLCKVFKISTEELEKYQNGSTSIPTNYKDECMSIIYRMDDTKLKAVYGILVSLK